MIQIIDKETWSAYFKLMCCITQLIDYFYVKYNETIFVDYYDFCVRYINDDDYEFHVISSPGSESRRWQILYKRKELDDEEIKKMIIRYSLTD